MLSGWASQNSGHKSESIFDDSFNDAFDKMDQEDRVFDQLDEGLENWEQRCKRTGGQEALDNFLKAQEDLVFCVMQNFPVDKIQREIEQKKSTGDLDILFKKYCE